MVAFLGIGAQKAGTSWLYMNLRSHPDVWMPFLKEVHYYDVRFLPDNPLVHRLRRNFNRKAENRLSQRARPLNDQYVADVSNSDKLYTQEWYDRLFSIAPEGMVTGEITPAYCAIGEDGIEVIKGHYPDVRLIYLIRDPYRRMVSSLSMALGNRLKPGSTSKDVLRISTQVAGTAHFLRLGDYAANVPRWDRHLAGQVLYLPFGRIKTDPAGLLREVESFIGVKPRDRYQDVERARNKGEPIEIPEAILDRFRKLAEPQREFLEQRFGAAFADQIT